MEGRDEVQAWEESKIEIKQIYLTLVIIEEKTSLIPTYP